MFQGINDNYMFWNDATEVLPGNKFGDNDHEFLLRISFEDDLQLPIYIMAFLIGGTFVPSVYCLCCDDCKCDSSEKVLALDLATITHWALIRHRNDD